jgi:DTW domain-containing protein YfiP
VTAPLATAPLAILAKPRRPCCARCDRPSVVCVCSHVTILPSRTRILLLQHPREHRVGVGTARLAHLALPSSTLRVGLDFAGDPVVRAALAGASPTYVLFPGPAAIDVADLPRALAHESARGVPLTLVVIDGTWSQARKLLHLNPALAALPRVAFTPRHPSDYRIRRQPAEHCVSTIEALAETLTALEPDGGPFARLLDPFRAMVARQEWFAAEVRSQRHRHPVRARRPSRREKLAARLAEAWPRLVCVQGEANAWPARTPARPDSEIVHWLAHRPATGESFEAVVAPRQALAPSTPRHIELPAARLMAGGAVGEWQRAWSAFRRPGDVFVQWGHYYGELATGGGLDLAGEALDLRREASQALRRRLGTVDECVSALDSGPAPPASAPFEGRAGRRLAALIAALAALRAAPVDAG